MTVAYSPEQTGDGAICAAVEKAGYGAALKRPGPQSKAAQSTAPDPQKAARSVKRRLVISFAFLIPLFYISMGHMLGAPLPHFFHGEQGALVFAFTQFLLVLPILAANHRAYCDIEEDMVKGMFGTIVQGYLKQGYSKTMAEALAREFFRYES